MKLVKTSGAAIALTAATLLISGAVTTSAVHADLTQVKCAGLNACKGQSACKTASSSCQGQNACKGQGFVMKTKAACKYLGGKIIG
jgi:uncharacterized membrane protein